MGKFEEMFHQAREKEQAKRGDVVPQAPHNRHSIFVTTKTSSRPHQSTLISLHDRWRKINDRLALLGEVFEFCTTKDDKIVRLLGEAENGCLAAAIANNHDEFNRLVALYLKAWGKMCDTYLTEKEKDGSLRIALLTLHLGGVKFHRSTGSDGQDKETRFFYREVPFILVRDISEIIQIKEIKEVFPGAEVQEILY